MKNIIHKIESFDHNGERSRVESGWTWVCSCGASESASTKKEAEFEWRMHIAFLTKQVTNEKIEPIIGLIETEIGKSISIEQGVNFVLRVIKGHKTCSSDLLEIINKSFFS